MDKIHIGECRKTAELQAYLHGSPCIEQRGMWGTSVYALLEKLLCCFVVSLLGLHERYTLQCEWTQL